MRAMTAGFAANGNQNESSTLYLLDFAFRDAQLRRIDHVVGRIDRDHRRLDLAEIWIGIVEPRGLFSVDDVIGILVCGLLGERLLHHLDHTRARWILLLHLERAAGHE